MSGTKCVLAGAAGGLPSCLCRCPAPEWPLEPWRWPAGVRWGCRLGVWRELGGPPLPQWRGGPFLPQAGAAEQDKGQGPPGLGGRVSA